MDSITNQNYQHQQQQNQQQNLGLLRFRSAPSSLLANFADNMDSGVDRSSLETEKLISRFMNSGNANSDLSSGSFREFEDKSQVTATDTAVTYGLPPHYPRQSSTTSSSARDGSYRMLSSMAMDHQMQSNSVNSSLLRQSSSPAGLFAYLSGQNGYASMKGMSNYSGTDATDGEVSPSTKRLKSRLSFPSSLSSSSLGILPQISEIGNESIESASPDDGKLGSGNGDARFCGPGFTYRSWNDSSQFSESFNGMKGDQDNDGKLFSGSQNGNLGNRFHLLSHHLSLPKTSAQMNSMEKFLQFQDSVPCKIRAKRGCATHPRSIAERVRRTRISERMRKLQELVPNMDKQTNTADMLDLAVDYIKDLQRQYKTLIDSRANCKCLSVQKSVPNQVV